MAYKKLTENIHKRFTAELNEIEAIYNFDYGGEFEVAICELLEDFLPKKYGVCRGFAINKEGKTGGDDIFMYDKERFLPLRFLRGKYSRKQSIPIEACYAYIEAKHTIDLEGTENQSLKKALSQVLKVKEIVEGREKVTLGSIDPYMKFQTSKIVRKKWPNHRNPFYTAIIARNVKIGSNKKPTHDEIIKACREINISSHRPDLLVIGPDIVYLPVYKENNSITFESPFFILGNSKYAVGVFPEKSFTLGFLTMLYAIDTIKLGKMPYYEMIGKFVLTARANAMNQSQKLQ